MGRRLLQAILSEKAGATDDNLAKQIEQAEKENAVPSYIQDGLHFVRGLGNLAAHPMRSQATGVLWDAENGEAELTIKIVEALLDFYFVQPALLAKQKADLNLKLQEAGKKSIT